MMDSWHEVKVACALAALWLATTTACCTRLASAQPMPSSPPLSALSAKPSPPAPVWHPLVVSPSNCPTCGLAPEGGVAWPLAEAQKIHSLLRAESLTGVVRALPQLQADLDDRGEALEATKAALAEEREAKAALKASAAALEVKAAAERERSDSLASALQHTREALKAASSASESSLWTALKWTALVAAIAGGVALVAYAAKEIRAAAGSSSSSLKLPPPPSVPRLLVLPLLLRF